MSSKLSKMGITYSAICSDSVSGTVCNSVSIDSQSSCLNGICSSDLFMSSSCLTSQYINVSIKAVANDSHLPVHIYDTAKVGMSLIINQVIRNISVSLYLETTNNFVKVYIDRNEAKFYCKFVGQQITKKTCKVYYGSESSGCWSLPFYLQLDVTYSNSVGGRINKTVFENTSSVCFSVEASDGNKSIIVKGIYDTEKGT